VVRMSFISVNFSYKYSVSVNIFSIQKAALFGITALTSIAMTGSFNINSIQTAISNRSYLNLNSNSLNPEIETGNSSFTKLSTFMS